MTLQREIQNFQRDCLRRTETSVTRNDGLKFIEKQDETGNLYAVPTGSKVLPFVEDLKPDLQIAEVLPGLFLGSVDVASEKLLLEKYRISHILTITSMNLSYFPGEYTYKHVLLDDLPSANIAKHFDECFSFIEEALASGGKVLVHCMAGVSRSPSIIIAYLMKCKGLKFDEAYYRVKCRRPVICPNEGFLKQLKDLNPAIK